MKVIKQTSMTPARLVSTNVVEENPAWGVGTTYAKDDLVYEGLLGVYKSLIDTNIGNQPSASPLEWVRIGPSNIWAMFDQSVSTQTNSPAPITVVVDTGLINSIAFINVVCNSITVSITDGASGPVIYNQTKSLSSPITSWYDYFFADLEFKSNIVFTDIPLYSNSRATITFNGAGNLSVGEMIFGKLLYLGATQYGMSAGIIDYSVKDTDAFGNTILTQRVFRKTINPQLWVDNLNHNKVQKLLYSLRATPAVWIATDDDTYNESALIYGFYKDFYTEIAYPTVSICKLEIESLA